MPTLPVRHGAPTGWRPYQVGRLLDRPWPRGRLRQCSLRFQRVTIVVMAHALPAWRNVRRARLMETPLPDRVGSVLLRR